MVSVETQTDHRPHTKSTTFYVGDSSEESDDEVNVTSVITTETQTDESVECQLPTEPRPSRPLRECVAILRSSVRLRLASTSSCIFSNLAQAASHNFCELSLCCLILHLTNIPVWFGLLGDIWDGCTQDRCTRPVVSAYAAWHQMISICTEWWCTDANEATQTHCYNPVAPAYPIWAYYVHGRQRRCQEDPVSLPSGRLEKTTGSSPHHVAQHRPTGSETTPPYAPRSSRFGSEPLSVEDDVSVWRYAIMSCMPETMTTSHFDFSIVWFDFSIVWSQITQFP